MNNVSVLSNCYFDMQIILVLSNCAGKAIKLVMTTQKVLKLSFNVSRFSKIYIFITSGDVWGTGRASLQPTPLQGDVCIMESFYSGIGGMRSFTQRKDVLPQYYTSAMLDNFGYFAINTVFDLLAFRGSRTLNLIQMRSNHIWKIVCQLVNLEFGLLRP